MVMEGEMPGSAPPRMPQAMPAKAAGMIIGDATTAPNMAGRSIIGADPRSGRAKYPRPGADGGWPQNGARHQQGGKTAEADGVDFRQTGGPDLVGELARRDPGRHHAIGDGERQADQAGGEIATHVSARLT